MRSIREAFEAIQHTHNSLESYIAKNLIIGSAEQK